MTKLKLGEKLLRLISPAVSASALGLSVVATVGFAQKPAAVPAVKNIILVHGAWADGSSWSKIIPLLQNKGFHVTAVHLAFTSLADDAATVKRELALQDGPTLVVGHSYGGAVITEAGNDEKVSALVYVAAFAPNSGESVSDALKAFPPTPGVKSGVPDASGFVKLSKEGIMRYFAPDVPLPEREVMAATEGQVSGPNELGAKITNAAWQHKATFYIVSDHDQMIPPALEEKFAGRMHAKTIHVSASHVPMISHPAEVADFIALAATGK